MIMMDNTICYPHAPEYVEEVNRFTAEDALDRLPTSLLANLYLQGGVSPCWIWTAGRSAQGYGLTKWANRVRTLHRLVYEKFVDRLPDGYHLDHLCYEKLCCNPNHLDPVTQEENLERGRPSLTAKRRAQKVCANGHILDVVDNRGRRGCSICQRRKWFIATRKRRGQPWE
jgi:hypothetical protein